MLSISNSNLWYDSNITLIVNQSMWSEYQIPVPNCGLNHNTGLSDF